MYRLGRYFESPLYNNNDIKFITRVLSINRCNYILYYYLDIYDKIVPLSRWSYRVYKKFKEVSPLIEHDIVNINNICSNCCSLKENNSCIICDYQYNGIIR